MPAIALVRRDSATLVPVSFADVESAVAYAKSRNDVEQVMDADNLVVWPSDDDVQLTADEATEQATLEASVAAEEPAPKPRKKK